mgnify:CR=1 FL=1
MKLDMNVSIPLNRVSSFKFGSALHKLVLERESFKFQSP